MDVLENQEQWEHTFRSDWLAHYERTGQIDWSLYPHPQNKRPIPSQGIELSRSRLMLISTAGGYLPGQQSPFDAGNLLGDYTIRVFPSTTPLDALAYAHTHYDHAAVDADPQVLVPLYHLQDMVTEGRIGALAPSMVSFMGYQPDLARVVDETAQAIAQVAHAEEAHAALLVPA
jgi:D-proline reductase (dithiol) PrdB